MTVGSLFSGIGGLDLGFEREGFEIKWQCEIDAACRENLRKIWPHGTIYEDVRTLRGSPSIEHVLPNANGTREQQSEGNQPESRGWPSDVCTVEPVDCLIGGFPCQDISLAGKGAGLDGSRSGLWWEYYRLVRELRPRYVVLENVRVLITRGLPAILGAFASIGFDAEWTVISAAAVGAPHIRERLFIVAYPKGQPERPGLRPNEPRRQRGERSSNGSSIVPNPNCSRLEEQQRQYRDNGAQQPAAERSGDERGGWSPESGIRRVAYGIPNRVDRLRGLGNAVVPAVAQYVARCIREREERRLKDEG